MFLEVIDPVTGQQTWKVADDNYDLAQEIARSGFGDMLHDSERNQKYEIGLKSVINKVCVSVFLFLRGLDLYERGFYHHFVSLLFKFTVCFDF